MRIGLTLGCGAIIVVTQRVTQRRNNMDNIDDDLNATGDVFSTIEKRHPEMSPSEVETEFLTLAWIGTTRGERTVIRQDMALFFVSPNNDHPPEGEEISSITFFNEYLGPRLIDAVKAQTVYVVNQGNDELAFMNKHEMSVDDFFLRAIPVATATAFIRELMLEKDIDDTETA